MIKYILVFLLSFSILIAEQNDNKPSELEMFLFKIGFDDVLKDVEISKEKSSLNENEIKTINEKIELIMNELYENKRVLLNDSEEASPIKKSEIDIKKEMQKIKSEIALIREDIKELRNNKEENKKVEVLSDQKTKVIEVKEKKEIKKVRVATDLIALYTGPNTRFEIIGKVKRNTVLEIDYCRFGWCKISDEKYYVREFLIKPYE